MAKEKLFRYPRWYHIFPGIFDRGEVKIASEPIQFIIVALSALHPGRLVSQERPHR